MLAPKQLRTILAKHAKVAASYQVASGPPDPLLRPYFGKASAKERTYAHGKKTLTLIDVTLHFHTPRIRELALPEKQWPDFKGALIDDCARRLLADNILFGSHTDIEHEDKVVFSCKKAAAAKIKKFLVAWAPP